MPKLPVVGAKELLKALKKAGFHFSFQSGSHATYKHPVTERRVTVPLQYPFIAAKILRKEH